MGSVPVLNSLAAGVSSQVSYVLEYACRSGYLVCALAAVPLPVRDRNIRQPRRKWPRNLYLLLPSPAPRSLHRSVSFSRSGVAFVCAQRGGTQPTVVELCAVIWRIKDYDVRPYVTVTAVLAATFFVNVMMLRVHVMCLLHLFNYSIYFSRFRQ